MLSVLFVTCVTLYMRYIVIYVTCVILLYALLRYIVICVTALFCYMRYLCYLCYLRCITLKVENFACTNFREFRDQQWI